MNIENYGKKVLGIDNVKSIKYLEDW